jgi:glycosyltransferase involved in cell wall biosynthesis
MLDAITPILLTYNEADNIGRTLSRLSWAKDIVVVDSGSNDETLTIIAGFPKVRIFHRPFDTLGNQWRFAMEETQVATPWVFRLDADYLVSEALIEEISKLDPDRAECAYRIAFDYAVFSRKLNGSLYPPNVVLLRRGCFKVEDQGHTEVWSVLGPVASLHGRITHDDHKPLSRWLASQQRYARLEAEFLLKSAPGSLSLTDRLRRTGWSAPLLAFFYALIVKRCLLSGWAGWYYALQRLLAETLIALELLDRRLRGKLLG